MLDPTSARVKRTGSKSAASSCERRYGSSRARGSSPSTPHPGMVVSELSYEEAREISEIRVALETMTIRKVITLLFRRGTRTCRGGARHYRPRRRPSLPLRRAALAFSRHPLRTREPPAPPRSDKGPACRIRPLHPRSPYPHRLLA